MKTTVRQFLEQIAASDHEELDMDLRVDGKAILLVLALCPDGRGAWSQSNLNERELSLPLRDFVDRNTMPATAAVLERFKRSEKETVPT